MLGRTCLFFTCACMRAYFSCVCNFFMGSSPEFNSYIMYEGVMLRNEVRGNAFCDMNKQGEGEGREELKNDKNVNRGRETQHEEDHDEGGEAH